MSHVCSDAFGRNLSEANVKQTALFVNSVQGFPWDLSLLSLSLWASPPPQALNETGLLSGRACSSRVLGLRQDWRGPWARAKVSSLNVTSHTCLCSCHFPPLCLDLDFLFLTNIVPTIQNLKETALVLRGRPYNLEAIQAFGQNWDQGVPIVAQWVKNLT